MPKKKDITGLRVGKLVALYFDKYDYFPSGERYEKWLCQCDCGKRLSVNKKNLLSGASKSCGCLSVESNRRRLTKHGGRNTRLYSIWCNMKGRCLNSSDSDYDRYGGRGINICNEWIDDYVVFRDWAITNGYNDSLTIDRVDVNKDYCPDNCRWVDMRIQANNRTNTIYIEYNGERHTCSEWADIVGISYDTLNNRYHAGMTGEDLFKRGRHKTGPKANK